MIGREKGFSILEVLIGIAILTILVAMSLEISRTMYLNRVSNRAIATRDRVLLGIQNLAGMPAALRNSMRASNGGIPVNPKLLACAGGNPLNACESNVVYPLTLYAPMIARTSTGDVIGIQAISSPLGSSTPLRLDTFGAPCSHPSPDCPFVIFTSFKAQCGPAPVEATAPPPTARELAPTATCTIADVIEVTFYLHLDPSVASDASLAGLRTEIQGSVVTSILSVSGNHPQAATAAPR